jgi:hypothetical protein
MSTVSLFSPIYALPSSVYSPSSQNLVHFFTDQSEVVWDGTRAHTLALLREFFASLPVTHHSIVSAVAHPIAPTSPDGPCPYLITVQGNLGYGVREIECGFSHSFTVYPDQSPQGAVIFIVENFVCQLNKNTLNK